MSALEIAGGDHWLGRHHLIGQVGLAEHRQCQRVVVSGGLLEQADAALGFRRQGIAFQQGATQGHAGVDRVLVDGLFEPIACLDWPCPEAVALQQNPAQALHGVDVTVLGRLGQQGHALFGAAAVEHLAARLGHRVGVTGLGGLGQPVQAAIVVAGQQAVGRVQLSQFGHRLDIAAAGALAQAFGVTLGVLARACLVGVEPTALGVGVGQCQDGIRVTVVRRLTIQRQGALGVRRDAVGAAGQQ